MSHVECKPAFNLQVLHRKSADSKNGSLFQQYREQWNERPRKYSCGNFPLHLDLESTSECNLRCSFCWANEMRDSGGHIEREMVQEVLKSGAEFGLRAVKFNLRGEPLMHPEIHELVRDAKQSGLVDVFFNTNGQLLNEEKAVRLIKCGLDRITISCEGSEEEQYKKFRSGADFNAIVGNVRMLQDLKKRFGVENPLVRVQTVRLPEIVPLLGKYLDFWKPLADEVCCTDYQDIDDSGDFGKYPWACPFIFQRMTILWDGTILPCDRDVQMRHPLGNAREVSVHKAWTSGFMLELRDLHKAGMAHKVDMCRTCSFRVSEIRKLNA
jgi:radical SAM protein with 4Fe4S-binding SPASM domain